MKQEDWQKIIDEQHFYHNKEFIKKQINIEREIVNEYATQKDLEFEIAERELAGLKKILDQPSSNIIDVSIRPRRSYIFEHDDGRGLTTEQELKELMSFGEKAISEFEKTRARKIIFPYVHLNLSTFGGWTGAAWSNGLHINKLIEKYESVQERFSLSAGMGTFEPLYFEFQYK